MNATSSGWIIPSTVADAAGKIRKEELLGELLKYYYRQAA